MYMRKERAAEFLDISIPTFDRWRKKVDFPAPRNKNGVLSWKQSELEAYMDDEKMPVKLGRKRLAYE